MEEKRRIVITSTDEKLQALCRAVDQCDAEIEELKLAATLKLKKLQRRSKAAWEALLDEGKERGVVPKNESQGEWGMNLEKNELTERFSAITYSRRDVTALIMKLIDDKLPKEVPRHIKEQMCRQLKEAIESGKPPTGMMLDLETMDGLFLSEEGPTPISATALSPTDKPKTEMH